VPVLAVESGLEWIGVHATPPLVTEKVTLFVSALSRALSAAIMMSPTWTLVVGRLMTSVVALVFASLDCALRNVMVDCAVAAVSAVKLAPAVKAFHGVVPTTP
jgi:hypothetical protein